MFPRNHMGNMYINRNKTGSCGSCGGSVSLKEPIVKTMPAVVKPVIRRMKMGGIF